MVRTVRATFQRVGGGTSQQQQYRRQHQLTQRTITEDLSPSNLEARKRELLMSAGYKLVGTFTFEGAAPSPAFVQRVQGVAEEKTPGEATLVSEARPETRPRVRQPTGTTTITTPRTTTPSQFPRQEVTTRERIETPTVTPAPSISQRAAGFTAATYIKAKQIPKKALIGAGTVVVKGLLSDPISTIKTTVSKAFQRKEIKKMESLTEKIETQSQKLEQNVERYQKDFSEFQSRLSSNPEQKQAIINFYKKQGYTIKEDSRGMISFNKPSIEKRQKEINENISRYNQQQRSLDKQLFEARSETGMIRVGGQDGTIIQPFSEPGSLASERGKFIMGSALGTAMSFVPSRAITKQTVIPSLTDVSKAAKSAATKPIDTAVSIGVGLGVSYGLTKVTKMFDPKVVTTVKPLGDTAFITSETAIRGKTINIKGIARQRFKETMTFERTGKLFSERILRKQRTFTATGGLIKYGRFTAQPTVQITTPTGTSTSQAFTFFKGDKPIGMYKFATKAQAKEFGAFAQGDKSFELAGFMVKGKSIKVAGQPYLPSFTFKATGIGAVKKISKTQFTQFQIKGITKTIGTTPIAKQTSFLLRPPVRFETTPKSGRMFASFDVPKGADLSFVSFVKRRTTKTTIGTGLGTQAFKISTPAGRAEQFRVWSRAELLSPRATDFPIIKTRDVLTVSTKETVTQPWTVIRKGKVVPPAFKFQKMEQPLFQPTARRITRPVSDVVFSPQLGISLEIAPSQFQQTRGGLLAISVPQSQDLEDLQETATSSLFLQTPAAVSKTTTAPAFITVQQQSLGRFTGLGLTAGTVPIVGQQTQQQQKQAQKQQQKQAQQQRQQQRQSLGRLGIRLPGVIPPPTTPPPTRFFDFDQQEKRQRFQEFDFKIPEQPLTGYAPSFTALTFGVTATEQPLPALGKFGFSPLQSRPIIIKKKKKKKKKKRR